MRLKPLNVGRSESISLTRHDAVEGVSGRDQTAPSQHSCPGVLVADCANDPDDESGRPIVLAAVFKLDNRGQALKALAG